MSLTRVGRQRNQKSAQSGRLRPAGCSSPLPSQEATRDYRGDASMPKVISGIVHKQDRSASWKGGGGLDIDIQQTHPSGAGGCSTVAFREPSDT